MANIYTERGRSIFQDKNILVTGGTGSIGSEIVREIIKHSPRVVRVFSNDENGLFDLEQELEGYHNVRFLVGDVRDKERLRRAVENIDFIFHAAALKHVPLCEYNPFEAVKTNVLGTQNLIDVAMEENIAKFITISTDKAVNPINVMGATKLLSERMTVSANSYKGARKTAFSCVRFGNVLDSRGSVVSLFKEQIKSGGPITLTDVNMVRFVMSLKKAVDLVMRATQFAQGGEIFILKMSCLRISDLADVMVEQLAPRYGYDPKEIKIEITGKRVGEKFQEKLMTQEEGEMAYELEDMVVLVSGIPDKRLKRIGAKKYLARDVTLLDKDQIRQILRDSDILSNKGGEQ